MTITQRVQELRSGFTPTFWIANILELFERLAFYGAKAILVIFLAERVGLKDEAATLAGTFTFVLYFLPIFAGVFVDKYGFRKSLMSCFFIFAIGYFLIGLAGMDFGQPLVETVGKKAFVIFGLMITAIGGSLIKPCIVGTVAYTSKPDFKALGFSIYYTLVNIGGAIGPILAMPVRKEFGIEFVLVTSAVTSALMLLGTFLFFKEPQAQDGPVVTKTFGKVFSDMLLVFANLRFMLFLIIFSGFWLMFWHIFYLLPFYVKDTLNFEDFELIETVDAFCIIFLTIPVTAMVKKFKPFTAMTLGFLIASLSWIVMGAFVSITATVIAVGIYSVGEALQSPRYYEYVSNLAPKGQLGTFMGFAFLPVAIGALGAGVIADYLKNNFLESNPSYMWFFLSGLGIVATTLMVLYNLFIAPKQVKQ